MTSGRTVLVIAALLTAATLRSQTSPGNSCVDCHLALDDATMTPPAKLFGDDVHARAGFTCIFCHGGDPSAEDQEIAHSPRRGFRGKPTPREIPELCGKCHSDATLMKRFNPAIRVDQLSEYRTSNHGKRLASGDTAVAQCASCHGAHGILPARDARSPVAPARVAETCDRCHGDAALMGRYELPADVYAKYKRSVHFRARVEKGDLSAPTCNSCHGNHGAAPPEVSSVAAVCGTCHGVFEEQFKLSAHWEPFAEMGLPSCVTCHENHEVVAPGEEFLSANGVCSSCHDAASAGGRAAATMRGELIGLRQEIDKARASLERAHEAGMEVSREQFALTQAAEGLTKARVNVHLARLSAVQEPIAEGRAVAQAGLRAGAAAMAERDVRRKGLFVSLALIVAAIVALLLTIREVDRRRGSGG